VLGEAVTHHPSFIGRYAIANAPYKIAITTTL